MRNFNNKQKGTPSGIIKSIVFIIAVSTMFGFIFQGLKLFSSFTYYLKFTSFGLELGFCFWLGHWAIGNYTEKKLDWTKNLKKANVISLSLYIIYGLIVSIVTSYIFGRYVLENTGESLFWDAFIKTLIISANILMTLSVYVFVMMLLA